MKPQEMVQFVALVAVGVFAAGYIMNALRDNDIVSSAIDGFDA